MVDFQIPLVSVQFFMEVIDEYKSAAVAGIVRWLQDEHY